MQKLTPVIVLSVGKKYFTCAPSDMPNCETQFHLDDWRQKTDYCQDQKLYSSEQEWEDEEEKEAICHEIWKAFEYGSNRNGLPLEALRRIKAEMEKGVQP